MKPQVLALAAMLAGWPSVPGGAVSATDSGGHPGSAVTELSYWHGRLSYRKKSTGTERGREDWWLTRNRDGTRTMRCLSMTDDSKFVRDVTYTLGADERPADAFVRLQVGDQVVGRGYFFLRGDQMRVITDARDSGHTEQTVPVGDRFHVTTHAVMLDGWLVWSYDLEAGGEQVLPVYNTSTRWNGTDGPLGRLETLRVTYLGEEKVSVPAGTFATRHYRFETDFVKIPASDIWVTGDDNLLVRYDWGGYDLEYVLVSLEEE
jgi:hypothetical protein